jgi:Ca2+-binding EF-hand superfamily protein
MVLQIYEPFHCFLLDFIEIMRSNGVTPKHVLNGDVSNIRRNSTYEQNSKLKKAAKDIESKFKRFYKFLPGDRDRVNPVRRRATKTAQVDATIHSSIDMAKPNPPASAHNFDIRRKYPFSRKNAKFENRSDRRIADNNNMPENNKQQQQQTTHVPPLEFLPKINGLEKKPEQSATVFKVETTPIIIVDMELEKNCTAGGNIKKLYKSKNAKQEFFRLTNSIEDCHNKGGMGERPLSARSKYIKTMKDMKLTPTPTSIIGKYKDNRRGLELYHAGFGDKHAYAIANSAFLIPDIQSINFNHNNLSPRSSQSISNCISPWIVNLNLSNNDIRSMGSKYWADGLGNAVNLEHLYMRNNKISDAGGAILIQALASLKQLRLLDLSENCLTNKSADKMRVLLIQSLSLKQLFLRWNCFSKHEMEPLSEGIFSNKNLLGIDLAFNSLGKCKSLENKAMKEETKLFFSSICKHPALTHVDLSFNELGVDDCDILQNVSDKNVSIVGFHIEGNRAIINHDGFIEETEDISSIKTYEELQHELDLKIATKVFVKLYFLWNEKNISPSMLFRAMNEDGEGNVDAEEFAKGLHDVCKLDISTKEVNAVFNIVDDDGSGEISQRELSRAIRAAGKVAKNLDLLDSGSESDNDLDIEDISFYHAPRKQPTCLDAQLSTKINGRCWICCGFSEQKILYKPYGYKNVDDAKSLEVFVYTSFDTFLPKKMMWNEQNKVYEYFCVVPPGFLRYYMTVNGRGTYSIDERSIPLTISGRIPQDLHLSQRKDGEEWWTLLKRLMFKTRRCNLRQIPVRRGPMINLFVHPRRTAKSKSTTSFYKDNVKAIVLESLHHEKKHGENDHFAEIRAYDIDEYDKSARNFRIAVERLLLHSVSIDRIEFINHNKTHSEKELLLNCCYKKYRIIQKLYNAYLIFQARNETGACFSPQDASPSLCLHLKTTIQFCVDFAIIKDEATKTVDNSLCIERSKIVEIFNLIAEDGYEYVNFNAFFRFLIKMSNVHFFLNRDNNTAGKRHLSVDRNISTLIFEIVESSMCMQLLNDYNPTDYIVKLFESDKVAGAIENIIEDVRFIFCNFSKKDTQATINEFTINTYGVGISTFLKLFSSVALHKCYKFSNETILSTFIASLHSSDGNNNNATCRSICPQALTFEEFIKAIFRVSYALLLVFFETHTATSSYEKVFQPILKEDILHYKSEQEIDDECKARKLRLPKVLQTTDFELIFSKIIKSEDALTMSMRFVVDAMMEQCV